MRIMVDLHDYDMERIEREILWKYNDNRQDYSDCDCLLSLRKDMVWICSVSIIEIYGIELWRIIQKNVLVMSRMRFAGLALLLLRYWGRLLI